MREIKFSGKRVSGNEWIIGDLNHIDGKTFIFDRTAEAPLNSPDWFEVAPESVGQFVGLLDKNGKEIYEGDIVKSYGDKISEVYFDLGCFYGANGTLITDNDLSEVIGNVYENPELLK